MEEPEHKLAESPAAQTGNTDLTIHVLESGEQVRTTERICKGFLIC